MAALKLYIPLSRGVNLLVMFNGHKIQGGYIAYYTQWVDGSRTQVG